VADTTDLTGARRVLCLDTSVLVKYFSPDEQELAATSLVDTALRSGVPLTAPFWFWAEIGSVLRKKLRAGLLLPRQASAIWDAVQQLPIDFYDDPAMRQRAWEIADRFKLPTLYDAAFLACTELAPALEGAQREFWTADAQLLRHLGAEKPAYVRDLRELAAVNPGKGQDKGTGRDEVGA